MYESWSEGPCPKYLPEACESQDQVSSRGKEVGGTIN